MANTHWSRATEWPFIYVLDRSARQASGIGQPMIEKIYIVPYIHIRGLAATPFSILLTKGPSLTLISVQPNIDSQHKKGQ